MTTDTRTIIIIVVALPKKIKIHNIMQKSKRQVADKVHKQEVT